MTLHPKSQISDALHARDLSPNAVGGLYTERCIYNYKNLTISYSSSFQHVLHMLEFKHMLAHAVNVSAYGLMLAHAGWCHSHFSIPERVGTYQLVLL